MISIFYLAYIFFFSFFFFLRQFRVAALWLACFSFFICSIFLLNSVQLGAVFEYQAFFFKFSWINFFVYWAVDFISLWFVWMTALLWVICVLYVWNLKYKLNLVLFLLAILNFILFNVFCVSDLFFFYVFFEVLLIPMFLIIGIWGSRERRIYAAFLFFFYTLLGSLFMLIALFFLYSHFGLLESRLLVLYDISAARQVIFWGAFFVSVAIKVPMFPVHIWLPEAHVEAPTIGSVILAGVLLKLGLFGLVKFLFPIFAYASYVFSPFVLILALLGVVYASIATVVQIDMKKLVAYSSVAHMNFVVLGIFVFNFQGFLGGFALMLSHGLVSSGLFLCVGILYERYKTRLLFYMGGLGVLMPLFNFFFFFFILSNMSFPGTFSFIGEITILLGVALKNLFLCLVSGLTMVFSAVYSLYLYSFVMLGSPSSFFFKKFGDISKREFFCIFFLFFFTLFFGIMPSYILDGFYVVTPYYLDFVLSLVV